MFKGIKKIAIFNISRIDNTGTEIVVFCCNNIQPKKVLNLSIYILSYFVTICNPINGYVKSQ